RAPAPPPGLPPADAVEEGAVPAGAVLELADASLAAGAPLHELAESPGVLALPAGARGLALGGDDHLLDPEGLQLGIDPGLPVAAVRRDPAQGFAHQGLDPLDG